MTNIIKLRIRNLKKSFGSKVVLDGVNLDIYEGKSLVVIGASGTGKSVLLKCIIGLLKPDSGVVEIDGKNVISLPSYEREACMRKFGVLFQGGALFDSLSVWENVAFGLIADRDINRSTARSIALKKLAQVGLNEDVANLSISDLSGGMQKRVSLARSIANDPKFIFFDEPTTGLDPIMTNIINKLIVKCTRDLGITGLLITHDIGSARKIADRIAMLYHGKIIWEGAVNKIDTSGNKYVNQFINGEAELR
ncbi:ribonucleotide ABC transporter ATP-binding protein [Candidatus Endolissoclinum faulkneri L5]|uniref:Ribonucleotide ABC transporter ATP-binding protein n=1 Tax=Candidatus Endolissoclinum faulkneri L5 TaxID=1401328 RepID=V9TWV6_9PROT|nr:ATP-binding cassette domain-containing protein [Candidatus Endolissoclinum faulkneri]AHC73800.1 ribonucleotide ABC transporter ATP-binding protein [Candidatus Endolissoclinum faulkneri L5]